MRSETPCISIAHFVRVIQISISNIIIENVYDKNEKVASGAMRFKDGIYYVSLDEEAAELLPGYFVKLIKK